MAAHLRPAFHAPSRPSAALAILCVLGAIPVARAAGGAQKPGDEKKPSLTLKATPPLGFSPLRVHIGVDVRGGPDDYLDFYCPTIEWDWGDGTVSENSEDCEPYQEGTSAIRRRFSNDHVYRQGGAYRVMFRLKQKTKVIASASANVQVRAGVRDELGR